MSLLDVAQLGLIILVAIVGVGWFVYEARKGDK
jgi:hypothetical protein